MSPFNEPAFGEFYQKTFNPLWTYVYRATRNAADADEIVQEAFYRVMQSDIRALSLEDQRRYVFRVAGNLMADAWKRDERERSWRARSGPQPVMTPPAVDDDVTRTFDALKPRERALLWLAYVEQHSHRQIAEALKLSRKSVKVLLARARARLRDLLTAQNCCPGPRC